MRLLDCSKLAINWKNDIDLTISRHGVIVNLSSRCCIHLIKFICCSKFHVNTINRSGVMIVFLYTEIPPSEFCPISKDWGQLLIQMSLIKFYRMLQNFRVTAFTVSELLRENQQGYPPPTQIAVKMTSIISFSLERLGFQLIGSFFKTWSPEAFNGFDQKSRKYQNLQVNFYQDK